MLRNFDEKRDYYRMTTESPITFNLIGENNQHAGTCINLSAGGVLIDTEQEIATNSQLEINITPKMAMVPPLHAIVEVLRVEENDTSNSYIIAGTIKEILQ